MTVRPGYIQKQQPNLANPLGFLLILWQHRRLILRLSGREIQSRYRGSFLGLAWAVLTPILFLCVYTFVFSTVFQARWTNDLVGTNRFTMMLFAGLLVFNFFAECVNRAPTLIMENIAYIKKVVFPLEALIWVSLLSGLFNVGISLILLVILHLIVVGLPPLTILWLPVVLAPLVAFTGGLVWFLASIGVFLRDLRQIISVITSMLMFLSPIFFPVSAVPIDMQPLIYLNPLTFIIEQVRAVAILGISPDGVGLLMISLGAWALAWLGSAWFMRTKKGFADVV